MLHDGPFNDRPGWAPVSTPKVRKMRNTTVKLVAIFLSEKTKIHENWYMFMHAQQQIKREIRNGGNLLDFPFAHIGKEEDCL